MNGPSNDEHGVEIFTFSCKCGHSIREQWFLPQPHTILCICTGCLSNYEPQPENCKHVIGIRNPWLTSIFSQSDIPYHWAIKCISLSNYYTVKKLSHLLLFHLQIEIVFYCLAEYPMQTHMFNVVTTALKKNYVARAVIKQRRCIMKKSRKASFSHVSKQTSKYVLAEHVASDCVCKGVWHTNLTPNSPNKSRSLR